MVAVNALAERPTQLGAERPSFGQPFSVSSDCSRVLAETHYSLSSSVIDDLTMHCERNPSFACAYFFFDGRNLEGELSIQEKYIRSLIRQLWDYLGRMPAALLGIYSTRSSHPQPSIEALQDTLQTIIGDFQEVYIVIDVLDACTDRDELLVWVKNLAGWKEGKLHLILSSRPELDIDDHWAALDYFERIRFAGGSGNPDIVNYVDDMLPENGKWTPETHALVRNVSLERADGRLIKITCLFHGLTIFSSFR